MLLEDCSAGLCRAQKPRSVDRVDGTLSVVTRLRLIFRLDEKRGEQGLTLRIAACGTGLAQNCRIWEVDRQWTEKLCFRASWM
jgi:hypothetical protein